MDIVFNTHSDLKIGSARINIYNKYLAFKNFPEISAEFNDFNNYENYDYAILHGAGNDEIFKAREQNEDIGVGLAKLTANTKNHVNKLIEADFLIADSHSQRDYYLKYNDNIISIPLVELKPNMVKYHREKSDITLAYHGSKHHLKSFEPQLKNAIERINSEYNIKLIAVYDIDRLGKWSKDVPDIEVEHIQHSKTKDWDEIHQKLVQADIGLVPAGGSISYSAYDRLLKETAGIFTPSTKNDYIQRFKSNTNAGRGLVFMQLGIPIVATPTPELRSIIVDGKTGFTALTEEAWIDSITRLHQSVQLRKNISRNAYKLMEDRYTNNKAAKKLKRYLMNFDKNKIHQTKISNSRWKESYKDLASTDEAEVSNWLLDLYGRIHYEGFIKTFKKQVERLINSIYHDGVLETLKKIRNRLE